MHAIQIKNLCKYFGSENNLLQVLHDLNVNFSFGELTMIIGPSGCGKTTFISIISGILSASSGDVFVIDQQINKLSDLEKVLFRRVNMGFVFQQYNMIASLTAAENVSLPLISANIKMSIALQEAENILKDMDLAEHSTKLPCQLSGGQMQRVAIARALIHQPKIIICDEPTAALDAGAGKAIMDILRQIANNPTRAVLIVSHDERVYHYADSIVEMVDGKIINKKSLSSQ